MNPQDDPREANLHQLFAARQRRDEEAAPGFERLLRRPARIARASRWSSAAAAALLLMLIAVGIVWRVRTGRQSLESSEHPTLATWKAPTDFLLDVPGSELLSSTPRFPDPNKEIL
jgi:hypothetical protein